MGYTDPILFLSEGVIKFDVADVVSTFDWVSTGMLMGKNQQLDMCALAFAKMTGAESSMLCDTSLDYCTALKNKCIDRLYGHNKITFWACFLNYFRRLQVLSYYNMYPRRVCILRFCPRGCVQGVHTLNNMCPRGHHTVRLV